MGAAEALVAIACGTGWFVALCIYDVRERRLPNALTLSGAVVILVAAAVAGRGLPALFGALCLVGVYLCVHLVSPAGMGAGDVKLALGIGALTGAFGVGAWVLSAVAAPLFTTAWAAVRGRRRSGPGIPHGPSMCLAASLAVALAASAS